MLLNAPDKSWRCQRWSAKKRWNRLLAMPIMSRIKERISSIIAWLICPKPLRGLFFFYGQSIVFWVLSQINCAGERSCLIQLSTCLRLLPIPLILKQFAQPCNRRFNFSTHLIENGTNLKSIQALLELRSSKTTGICTLVAVNRYSDIVNLLDYIPLKRRQIMGIFSHYRKPYTMPNPII